MSDFHLGRDEAPARRAWEAPALSVLMFRETAGSQEAGQDNAEVASFTPGGFTKQGATFDGQFSRFS